MTKKDIENIKKLAFLSDGRGYCSIIDSIVDKETKDKDKILLKLLSLLDITTLNDNDNLQSMENIVPKTICRVGEKTIGVGGLCVYSNLLPLLNKQTLTKEVKRVVVSAGFPTAQLSLQSKLSDIRFCIKNNADEIDIPINRGLFFENRKELQKELRQISTLVHKSDIKLKVILETSELKTYKNIYDASILAMECGADFIKTSTGKVSRGADVYSSAMMLFAVHDYYFKTKRLVGFKAAGGIRSYQDALKYHSLAKEIMGAKYINKETFRIGCSNLRDDIINNIDINNIK